MAKQRKDKTLRRVTVSVDPDDYAAMERLAVNSEVTTAWLVRRAMREFLVRYENEAKLEVPLRQVSSAKNDQYASE